MLPPPLLPRSPFISLPHELLVNTALSLDIFSAISLSLTCRAFVSVANLRIHQDLALALGPSGHSERHGWFDHKGLEGEAVSEANREGLKEKIKHIVTEGGAKRLDRVTTVTIRPYLGAAGEIVEMLETVSPKLENLFLRRAYGVEGDEDDRDDEETFDIHFTTAVNKGLSFPALTHIHISSHSIRYAESLLSLCASAPNLLDLEIDFSQAMYAYNDHGSDPIHPWGLAEDTKIKRMRATYSDRLDVVDNEQLDLAHPLVNVIRNSPELELLWVSHVPPRDYDSESFIEAVSVLPKLRELHSSHDLGQDLSCLDFLNLIPKESRFVSLRKVLFRVEKEPDFWDMLVLLEIPSLEAIFIEYGYYGDGDLRPPGWPSPSRARSILYDAAAFVRRHPRLSIIHLLPQRRDETYAPIDEVEKSGRYNVRIYSYVRGESEIIHVRRLTHFIEKYDKPLSENPVLLKEIYGTEYTAVDGRERMKATRWYNRRANHHPQNATFVPPHRNSRNTPRRWYRWNEG